MKLFASNFTDTLRKWSTSLSIICKIRPKKVVKGPRDQLLEFWSPLISRERLKLETSNLAWELRKKLYRKYGKLGQRGDEGAT